MEQNKAAQIESSLKAMRVRQHSIIVNERFVAVRVSRSEWRLGELMGDWLMHGTARDVAERATR